MRRRAGPVAEISVTELEMFPYEHSSPGTGTVCDETFSTAHPPAACKVTEKSERGYTGILGPFGHFSSR